MSVFQRNLIIGFIVVLALVGCIYFFFIKKPAVSPGLATNNMATTTATTTMSNGVSGTGSFAVVPVEAKAPSLSRPITINPSLPEDAKQVLQRLLTEQIAILQKDPTRADVWLQYGTNRKIAGDYEGAAEVWEYVAQTGTNGAASIAIGNLGDLYMYFIKDYAKAETRFNQAIALNPKMPDYYRSLFYLYRDIYKDKVKAAAILEQGLKNNPDSNTLIALKAEL